MTEAPDPMPWLLLLCERTRVNKTGKEQFRSYYITDTFRVHDVRGMDRSASFIVIHDTLPSARAYYSEGTLREVVVAYLGGNK